ncbi:folylpolyglutamate synthase/dihydrofolate synthase family protein [Telmatospirillum sp.]|uniref:bifunctional folylpolyglutamate synthase/dihydrofolate synthase n=1 Tax=Telmatospirillum sp. TaxID=2079197 RepID=UPI002840F333|nr:folylpolyglutamate synthase/dihydrofolate synthase family protein [Telmatospirillum sp.]MDR3440359.1 bifunctional folylpolyglutamate synthase/dihydrofolate synthase [Telmatospirillum sp.]
MIDAVLERLKGLHPKVIDLALDRVLGLLAELDHPERHLPPVIHVAGTNGKGSTLAYLRAIAEAAGKDVHVYTSPHLVRFAERIRVAGRIIDDEALLSLLTECERRNAGRPITFFEITTAAAFLAFARRSADLCLLETGLGGRYDATNVIDRPVLTLLTPISLDHQAFLGNTVAAIASEKAGILKPGVPCLSARQEPEALAVIAERAAALGAPLLVEDRDWRVSTAADGFHFTMGGHEIALPSPALPGAHQIHNAGLAVAAALSLSGHLEPSPTVLARGLCRTEWPARLQRLTSGPLPALLPDGVELWLDGGHNPSAGQALASFIKARWNDRPLDIVAGMLDTKDSQGFFAPLAPLVRRMRGVSIPGEVHSRTADGVCAAARAEGLDAVAAPSVAAAIADLAPASARILICGSLYLAGTILAANG